MPLVRLMTLFFPGICYIISFMFIDVSLPLEAGMVFRHGSPAVFLKEIDCYHRDEGNYRTHVLSMPLHSGTHVDLVDVSKPFPAERCCGTGLIVDVSGIGDRDIEPEDISRKDLIDKVRFVFFRTGWDVHIRTSKYFDHPQLSPALVEWLAEKDLNMVGIDAMGLGRGANHGVYDRLLTAKDIFVIENLCGLSRITVDTFEVFCFPLSLSHVEALPARVMIRV
ncbi:MAG: hypothetical protein E4H36_10510 [Spirochaetales bacterium]|nr:MAG: hypothetical protein E4H36_10510 [Spirochaetales bacterium]